MTEEYIWNENLTIGIKSIDHDHQWLFMVINEMDSIDAEQVAGQQDRIRSLLLDFLSYTAYHFKREEELMEKCNFPGLDDHRYAHEFLKKKVVAFVDKCRKGFSPDDFKDFKQFQKNWWLNHILDMDRGYAPYLQAIVEEENES